MNAFNEQVLAEDPSGLTESCDACNRVILNWNSVGDAATLSEDGKTILCRACVFQAFLERASATVASWPKWKREILRRDA
jgi:hypothetical protein